MSKSRALVFDEFFESGQAEDVSPFLTPSSRRWAKNLRLKASILAALLLSIAFSFSFTTYSPSFMHLLLIMVYFLAGTPALIDSIEDILDLEVNIDVLMTLAAFSSVLLDSTMEGALLLVLFDLAGSIENTVTAKAVGTLHSLHKLSPTTASVLDQEGNIRDLAIQDIDIGTPILVRAGEVVPLDGEILEGASLVNLVHLTGESKPIQKKKGDHIAAGARTLEGSLTLKVTHTSHNSTLARIIKLITQAHTAKPALQRWFDQLSRRYALTIISLAAFFACSIPFVLGIPFFTNEGSIYRALAFLIASSPCALIIAIPTAYLSAISACARQGILLKGGFTLDALASCQMVAFDKTGTLTTGELHCKSIESIERKNIDEQKALALAAALERNAKHPIAQAIVKHARDKKTPPVTLKEFRAVPGYGLQAIATWNDKQLPIFIGNAEFIIGKLPEKKAVALLEKIREIETSGDILTVLLVDQVDEAINQEISLFRFRDTLRPQVAETLQQLKQNFNLQLLMLTGDHQASARPIAQKLGLDRYYTDLRPEDKLRFVSTFADEKGLAMVGDGINDAPSLARATVGISMGSFGSATAIEASDIVLLHDNLNLLKWLIKKSKKTQRIVTQNLILASGVIALASLPALLGMIPLGLAVLLHEGGTVLVGLNGIRLLRK